MQSISLRSHVGADGILQLEIPIGLTNVDLEVMVIVQPLADTNSSKTPEALGWPPFFLRGQLEHGKGNRLYHFGFWILDFRLETHYQQEISEIQM